MRVLSVEAATAVEGFDDDDDDDDDDDEDDDEDDDDDGGCNSGDDLASSQSAISVNIHTIIKS